MLGELLKTGAIELTQRTAVETIVRDTWEMMRTVGEESVSDEIGNILEGYIRAALGSDILQGYQRFTYLCDHEVKITETLPYFRWLARIRIKWYQGVGMGKTLPYSYIDAIAAMSLVPRRP